MNIRAKISLISLLLIIGVGVFFGILHFRTKNLPDNSSGTGATNTGTQDAFIEYQSREDKVAEAKRRLNFRSIIRKGDYYSIKNDKESALRYYLNAESRLGSDKIVERKMADTYFDLKDWKNAYIFYKKLPYRELDQVGKDRLFAAFMYDDTLADRQKELDLIPEDANFKEYYIIAGTCTTGIHNCVIRIQESKSTDPRVKELAETVSKYEELSWDLQYRNSLLAGTFYKQRQFRVAAKLADEILENRPNYKVVLKIAGFSRFELGQYDQANERFKAYYNFEPKDTEVSYALGVINYYLADYATSNLYFNSAVLNGYRPKTELERRLVYNYYLLGDKKSTFKIFYYLLGESDATQEDFEIAVFTAIEENDISKGLQWANKWLSLFPDNDRLFAMRGWIYRLSGQEGEAVRDLQSALDRDSRNPIALLQFGLLYSAKNEYTLAKTYLQTAIEADTSGTFWDDAKNAINDILSKETVTPSGSGTTLSGSETQENASISQ